MFHQFIYCHIVTPQAAKADYHEIDYPSGFYFVEHPLVFRAPGVCAAKAPITKELWILESVFRRIRGKSIHLVFAVRLSASVKLARRQ